MFSLSDTLPLQSYLSKVWFLCVAVHISVRHCSFPTDLFFYMNSVADKVFALVLPSHLSDVHFDGWILFGA